MKKSVGSVRFLRLLAFEIIMILIFGSGSGIIRGPEIFEFEELSLFSITKDHYSDAQRTLEAPEDMDIDAAEGWKLFEASKQRKKTVTVAVIDTGVDYQHEDLADIMWVNTGEIPDNGIDDDGNGYIDDVYGWDFYNNDNTVCHYSYDSDGRLRSDPEDCDDHGTHIAGIISAIRDNEVGIAGVASCADVRIMSLKIHGGTDRNGKLTNAVKAIKYAEQMGADICNISWGTEKYNEALYQAMADSKMLFCVAAGNNGTDIDTSHIYPASFILDNMITVAYVGENGKLARLSNYGAESVDVAVPAGEVFSTVVGGYKYMGGSSMAAPHVTGLAALLYSLGVTEPGTVRERICANVRPLDGLKGFLRNPGIISMKDTLYNNGKGRAEGSADTGNKGTGSGGTDTGNKGTGSGGTDTGNKGTGSGGTDTGNKDTGSGGTDTGNKGTGSGGTDTGNKGTGSGGTDTGNKGTGSGGNSGAENEIDSNSDYVITKIYDGDMLLIKFKPAKGRKTLPQLRYLFGTKKVDAFKNGLGGLAIESDSLYLDKEGKYTFYCRDRNGNEKVRTYLITDDALPPKIENIAVKVSFDYKTITISAGVSDLQSGIKKVKILKGSHTVSDFIGKDGTELEVKNGKVSYTAEAQGTYTLYACDLRGNKTVKTVMCYIRKATSVSLARTKKTMKIGAKYSLKPVLYPMMSTDAVKYTSSNKKVATVSRKGVITAKKKGKAVITVTTASGVKTRITVTVKKAAAKSS